MRILVYHNPNAGHERELPEALVESLRRAGHELERKNIKERSTTDVVEGFDLVVAAGGDGSVGRTARQLVGSTIPIAVLPFGTANNLASILDAGKHDLIDRIEAWAILQFDAGTIEWEGGTQWFFEGFGVGAFAETAARLTALAKAGVVEKNREAELARDVAALAGQAVSQPAFDAEMQIDGKVTTARLIMLEVLNIGLIGPNVELAAGVDPTDGELDVIMVEERQRADLAGYLDSLAAGRKAAPPFISIRGRHVRLTLPAGGWAHLDGASLKLTAGAEVVLGLEPRAVRFLGGTSS